MSGSGRIPFLPHASSDALLGFLEIFVFVEASAVRTGEGLCRTGGDETFAARTQAHLSLPVIQSQYYKQEEEVSPERESV